MIYATSGKPGLGGGTGTGGDGVNGLGGGVGGGGDCNGGGQRWQWYCYRQCTKYPLSLRY